MKIKIVMVMILIVSVGSMCVLYSLKNGNHISFDESMRAEKYSATITKTPICGKWYSQMQELYERNSPDKVPMAANLKIPKIIHQIWLGGPFPEEYKQFSHSWFEHHPQWQFVLWTDYPDLYPNSVRANSFEELHIILKRDDLKPQQFIIVDARNLAYENKQFFDASGNYGERSDILKWELIYRFGGMYVDTDFECVRPLDDLHYMYDFYTGIQPLDTDIVQLGAALYAAFPGHPILKGCIEGIKYNQHIKQIVAKTGPIHFTKVFMAEAGRNGLIDVALPASYLYPRAYYEAFLDRVTWLRPESYAVHHWAGSWLKPEGRVH